MKKRMFVIVQDSAFAIYPNKIANSLDKSLRKQIQVERIPINVDGKTLIDILQEMFEQVLVTNPEVHILLITSSMIYGHDFFGNYGPKEIGSWLKENFTNSSYAVRSMDKISQINNVDFYFNKETDLDKGIAKNITHVFNTVFKN